MPRPSKRKQHLQKRKAQPTKCTQPKPSDFEKKSKEAAIAQVKVAKTKQRQRQLSHSSRLQLDTSQLHNNKSIEVINLASGSSQGGHVTIYTSNDPAAFITTPSRRKPKNLKHTNRKIDKIINGINNSSTKQQLQKTEQIISLILADHSTPTKQLTSVIAVDHSTPTEQNTANKRTTEQGDPNKLINYNNQLVTHEQPDDIITAEQQQAPAPPDNTPEKRQYTEKITEVIHMEEPDHGDAATLSSISPLNTEDIEALDKIFD